MSQQAKVRRLRHRRPHGCRVCRQPRVTGQFCVTHAWIAAHLFMRQLTYATTDEHAEALRNALEVA